MNLKKVKIISIIGIFLMAFLVHFVYDKFPNDLTSIFFPVNESIWEHMKMLFTTVTLYSIVEYLILKKSKILYHNFLFMMLFSAIIIIPIFLIIFLPVYNIIGENFIVTIIIMLISIIITEILSYYILKTKSIKWLNYSAIILYIICYIVFGYLTYNPIESELFRDPIKNKYGINTYIIK